MYYIFNYIILYIILNIEKCIYAIQNIFFMMLQKNFK